MYWHREKQSLKKRKNGHVRLVLTYSRLAEEDSCCGAEMGRRMFGSTVARSRNGPSACATPVPREALCAAVF